MKRISLSVLFGLITMLLFAHVLLAQATAIVDKNANLRSGPGTTYAVAGNVKAGATVTIVGSNAAGDWYQLEDGKWIAAFLVKNVSDDVPTVDASATVTPTVASGTSGDEATIEAAYVKAIGPILNEYVAALNTFVEEMGALEEDTSLLFDGRWKVSVAGVLLSWDTLADEARALRPPARLTDVHNQILIAATHYETASGLMTKGIDELDEVLLQQAGSEMSLGTKAMELAGNMMNSLPTPTATALPTKPAATATATPKVTTVATKASPTNTPAAAATAVPPTATTAPVATTSTANCDPSYPTLCIPPGAPDLDCGDITDKRFPVLQPDPHRFDGNKDGVGCES